MVEGRGLVGWAVSGLCLVGVAALTLNLQQGDMGGHVFILCALLGSFALGLFLLKGEKVGRTYLPVMAALLSAALLLRVFCLEYVSDDYTMFLAHWAAFFRENGGFPAMSVDVGDYNVPYLYFVAAISYLDVPDLYLYKVFSILFDVLLAWGGLRLVRALRGGGPEDTAPLFGLALLLFLPTVVLNGSLWGQCDAIYGALVVHSVALALEDRGKLSIVLMAAAFSFKLQTVFVLPLWGVLWLSGKVKFRELWLFPLTYGVTILPALLLGKPLGDILRVYVDQAGEYARLTLNAPSVFQFIPYRMEVDEGLLAGLGILAAALLVLVLLAVGFFKKNAISREGYMAAAVVLAIGVPFFLPHMHERYFFLADVLTLCWGCANLRRTGICLLAAGSSLASYMVFLRLKFNWIVTVSGYWFVMGAEALAMLSALVWSAAVLVLELQKLHEQTPPGGAYYPMSGRKEAGNADADEDAQRDAPPPGGHHGGRRGHWDHGGPPAEEKLHAARGG